LKENEMSSPRKTLTLAALAVAACTLAPATASAEERTCRGTIGARTLDNIRVPQGATCALEGTTAQGTVKVERNAILKARHVRVIGNVQAENARMVNVVRSSHVGGSIQVVQGRSGTVRGSRVNADILYDDNTGALRAIGNRVGGNIQAFQNTGGVEIARNTVDGNLQCKENRPRPTGGRNTVHGNKEDQCARL
jgi:hypothetical protein